MKVSPPNAERIVEALIDFGFGVEDLKPELFLEVEFDECYNSRIVDSLYEVEISFIGLDCLKKNKMASGRLKDLSDLEYLSR